MIDITLGNKQFKVKEAKTQQETIKGLMGVKELPKDEGMIFYFDPPRQVSMWMHNTLIPLDIIFINEDQEVIAVEQGKPEDDTFLTHDNVAYVVELNTNSGIKKGDILEFNDDSDIVMKVLAPNGSSQMNLKGGERIVSRRETKILIRKAVKAHNSDKESDYKSLGKYMFKVLDRQDNRQPEFVDAPK